MRAGRQGSVVLMEQAMLSAWKAAPNGAEFLARRVPQVRAKESVPTPRREGQGALGVKSGLVWAAG